jgi:hypothetical protein
LHNSLDKKNQIAQTPTNPNLKTQLLNTTAAGAGAAITTTTIPNLKNFPKSNIKYINLKLNTPINTIPALNPRKNHRKPLKNGLQTPADFKLPIWLFHTSNTIDPDRFILLEAV